MPTSGIWPSHIGVYDKTVSDPELHGNKKFMPAWLIIPRWKTLSRNETRALPVQSGLKTHVD